MDLCTALEKSQTVGAIVVSIGGVICNANEHAAELFELDRITLIGRHLVDCVAPEAKLACYRRLDAIKNGDLNYFKTTKPLVTINGRRFTASFEGWTMKQGNVSEHSEMLLYHLPNGHGDAQLLEMRQELDAIKQIVVGLVQHSKAPISINTIAGGENRVGDNS